MKSTGRPSRIAVTRFATSLSASSAAQWNIDGSGATLEFSNASIALGSLSGTTTVAPDHAAGFGNDTLVVGALNLDSTFSGVLAGSDVNSALAPFHTICTPMHTSKNDVSCRITVMPVVPSTRPSRSAKL